MIQGNIYVAFSYKNQAKKDVKVNASVPRDAVIDGDCGSDTDNITMDFDDSSSSTNVQLSMQFKKTSSDYSLVYISVDYYQLNVSGTQQNIHGTVSDLQTDLQKSYNCTAGVEVQTSKKDLTLYMTDLQLQAFVGSTSKHPNFGSVGTDCAYAGKTNAIVPIAVGAALAAMVLIVLIGYCIGRRRTAASGYQSMNDS